MGDFLSKIKKENNKLGLKWMDGQAESSQQSDVSIVVEDDDGDFEKIFNKEIVVQDEEEEAR